VQRILIIDDEPMVRRSLYMILHCKGFEVIEAEDGKAGIEQARTQSPDLILSDVSMRPPNGYTVLQTLKEDPLTSGIPFLFLTGLVDHTKMQNSIARGAAGYVEKPFSVDTLLAVVHKHLTGPPPVPAQTI
jgi:CheY-like chemotaxis protein